MKEELARELAQLIINEKRTGDRMIFPINGSQELVIVTIVRTEHDPRLVNTQFLHLHGRSCPTCAGRVHV